MFAYRLDDRSGVPTYRQLVDQVHHAVMLGRLAAGDQLPTVREVAASLAINPNTVVRAYRELERRGLAAPRAGLGTFVTADPVAQVLVADRARLRASLRRWMADARAAGLTPDQVEALVSELSREPADESGVA
ncbi:MAG: GntR family transcriptional regulator [Phycicoccus sp.]